MSLFGRQKNPIEQSLESGFSSRAEVEQAFSELGWPTDGVKGTAFHDPDNPSLSADTSVHKNFYSLRIDCRTFQDRGMLNGIGRRVRDGLDAAGGLFEMTPLALEKDLVIVPFARTEVLSIADLRCAVFHSMERAQAFAEHHKFKAYPSGVAPGAPLKQSG